MTLGRSDLPDQTVQSWLLLVLFAFVADLVVSKNNATTRVLAAVSFPVWGKRLQPNRLLGVTQHSKSLQNAKVQKVNSTCSQTSLSLPSQYSSPWIGVLTNSSGDRDNLMDHVLACREEHDVGRSCTI